MVSVPALFDRCVSSDQPLINTVKHGSALLLLLLHLSLSLCSGTREKRILPIWKPTLAAAQAVALQPIDLRLRQSPHERIASHFDAVPSTPP